MVYIFTTVAFIPGSLLTLGAGLVFGRALGTGLGVLVGAIAVLVSIIWAFCNGVKYVFAMSSRRTKCVVKWSRLN